MMHKHITKQSIIIVSLFCVAYLPASLALAGEKIAARVGGTVITEANILEAMGDAVSKTQANKQAVLDELVKRSLFTKQAITEKLNQDPQVLAAIETAKNQILSQAYVARLANSVHKPSADEVSKYYNAHPELFSQRVIYTLQEIAIAGNAAQLQAAAEQYKKIKSFNDMVEWLKSNNIPYTLSGAVKGAEEIPADFLQTLSTLAPGQVVKITNNSGLSILQLTNKHYDTKTLKQSTLVIERFLQNQALDVQLSTAEKEIRKKVGVVYISPYKQSGSQ